MNNKRKTFTKFIRLTSSSLLLLNSFSFAEELTWHEIAYRVIKNNSALKVNRFNPKLKKETIDIAKSEFSPQLRATTQVTESNGKGDLEVTTPATTSTFDNKDQNGSLNLNLSKKLNYGTQVQITGQIQRSDSDLDSQNISFNGKDNFNSFSIGIEQPLLDGRGKHIQETSIQQSNLEYAISTFELSAFAETLVYNSLLHALDLYAQIQTIDTIKNSIQLEQEELKHIKLKIKHGRLTKIDQLASEASLATRQQELSIWETKKEHSRLNLVHSFMPNTNDLWEMDISFPTYTIPTWASTQILELHLSSALKNRSDLQQSQRLLKHNNLSLNFSQNKLLPKLNFFTDIGYQDYQRRDAFNAIDTKGDGFRYQAGLSLELALSRKKEKALHQQASFTKQQTLESIKNLEGIIYRDIHKAFKNIKSFESQIKATKSITQLRHQILKDELLKRDLGNTTSLDVQRARNEYLESQKNEIETRINEFKARLLLFYRDGSLLSRLNMKI